MLDLIQKAIRTGRTQRKENLHVSEITEKLENLSAREREVLDGVVGGKSNRIIAGLLELSEKSVEFHRAKMLEKMAAATLADLIRMITQVNRAGRSTSLAPAPSTRPFQIYFKLWILAERLTISPSQRLA